MTSERKENHDETNFSCERNLPGRFVDYDKPCTCKLKEPAAKEHARK